MKQSTRNDNNHRQQGFALVTVMLLSVLLMALLVGYSTLTYIDMGTTEASMDSTTGFYAAEAGVNIRAEQIRQRFLGYNRPTGTAPDPNIVTPPCGTGNKGAGDFVCDTHPLSNRESDSYAKERPDNPRMIVVPRGEKYQNLTAQEYAYTLTAEAKNFTTKGKQTGPKKTEAILEMEVKSRLVPMFQFAAFYNKDLEILPGPAMTLAGPIHTNGDLYLDSGDSLDILGQVTTAGDLYRGRKNANTCNGNPVQVLDPGSLADLPACSGRTQMSQSALNAWNGMVETAVDVVTVPEPEALDPTPGEVYWDLADLRIMLDMASSPPEIQVRRANGSVNVPETAELNGCPAVQHSDTLYNNREGTYIDMLDVDVEKLLECIYANNLLTFGRQLDDTTEGGLVFYLGVEGPNMNGLNNYGVRVWNGDEIAPGDTTPPGVVGLTVVTNQAIYIKGDYNSINKIPAAFLADSLNILSNNWDDAKSTDLLINRQASTTTINAAFLAGTDSTGGLEGAGGQNGGSYNGGLENYPRFHETWSGETLTYRGSFVSLNTPRHVDGAWVYGGMQYTAPGRNWGYDTDFNDANNLPPASPRFVYLKQELFVRQFGL